MLDIFEKYDYFDTLISGINFNMSLNDPLRESKADLLAVMGNPIRLTILQLISESEWPVNALAERMGLSQSALSQHLAKLRSRRLVNTRREAQTVYYSGKARSVQIILKALDTAFEGMPLHDAWESRPF